MEAWSEMNPSPVGILDQFIHPDEPHCKYIHQCKFHFYYLYLYNICIL